MGRHAGSRFVRGLAAALALAAAVPAAAVPAPSGALPDSLGAPEGGGEDQLPFGTGTSYMLGATLMQQGDFQGALPYLHHAYRLAPEARDIADAYLNVLLGLGYGDQALSVLADMMRRWPEEVELRRRRIALLGDMQRPAEALAEIARVREAGLPDRELLLLEAGLLAGLERVPEALAVYRRALAELPEEGERIYLTMAALLERAGDEAALQSLWEEACAALPGSRTLRYGLLRQLVRAGRIETALDLARRADAQERQASPDTAAGREVTWEYELIDLLIKAGHERRALRLLREAREAGRLELDGDLWLARLLIGMEDWDGARRLLEELTAEYPGEAAVPTLLGELLVAREETAAGEAALRRAVALEPADAAPYVALVRLLILQHEGDLASSARGDSLAEGARREIAELAARAAARLGEDDHRGRMILGYAFRSLGDPDSALPLFEAAAAAPGLRLESLLQLAIAQDEAGRGEDALRTLETLRRENPGDANVANSLGYFLADRGLELARAERLIRQALAAEPDNGAYLDSLGWVLFRQGRHAEALDQLILATNAIPEDATILEHLGLALHALGQAGEARRVLLRARELGADSEELRAALGQLEDETAPR